MKTLDVNTQSITESKKNLSKLLKQANETGEPTFIMNHNEPQGVLLSNDKYNELIERYEELQDQLFYSKVVERIEDDNGKRYKVDDLLENDEDNLFDEMTDEELFD